MELNRLATVHQQTENEIPPLVQSRGRKTVAGGDSLTSMFAFLQKAFNI
ncbi:MAG: hypothetical protein ABI683_06620 [Ginsengibacter sp.]